MKRIIKDIAKRKQLLTLYAIAFRLNSKQSLEKVMGDLLFQLHNMLRIDFSCIHLLEKGELKLKASLGLGLELETSLKTLSTTFPWVSNMWKGKLVKTKTPRGMVWTAPGRDGIGSVFTLLFPMDKGSEMKVSR